MARNDDTPLLSENQDQETLQCSDSLEISGTSHLGDLVGIADERTKSCRNMFLESLSQITVEPILLLNMLGWSIQSSLTTNLLLEK
ncbi:hypothetical protein SK128_012845, partial [Halocaridina rubra]